MRDLIGRTLGHYRIVEKIGEGGMGVVYRARDERLDRDVAIKVLPEEVAGVQDRLERFQREAKILASLNHPNIATLHGLEDEERHRFLVMELVEGESLARVVARGPIPCDEALPIGLQIAKALEAAHEQGIIHRDLKPANVMVSPEGGVKVLDFGLAKAWQPEDSDADITHSPTLTAQMTAAGVLLGTAAYMSPEQARGKAADKRADIWAFGVILFEMLTGTRLFEGETTSDVLAAVLRAEPDWSRLPPETPRPIVRLLHRCLEREPRARLHDIADARLEIDEAIARPSWAVMDQAERAEPNVREKLRIAWPFVLVAVALTLVIISGLVWRFSDVRRSAPEGPTRLALNFPAGITIEGDRWQYWPALAVSPDGRWLVFAAKQGDTWHLFKRSLEQFQANPMPGTEDGYQPFFSPDGRWVGFFADGKLKKVPLAGGTPQVLCEAPNPFGATWGPHETIVLHPSEGQGLWLVPANGGTPETVATPDLGRGDTLLMWPEFLPDGKAVLFTSFRGLTTARDARIEVLDLASRERRVLLENASYARYVPTGHLVFGRGGGIHVAPFDTGRRVVTGPSVPVPETVFFEAELGVPHLAFSMTGLLAFFPGAGSPRRQLVSVDMEGKEIPLIEARRGFVYPRFAPDGERLVVAIAEPGDLNLWLIDLARGVQTKFTTEGSNALPVWTPDGERVTFGSFRDGAEGVFWKRVDGSDEAENLLSPDEPGEYLIPTSWSPDGETLVCTKYRGAEQFDICTLAREGDRQPRDFLTTKANRMGGAVSPDGRWLAYVLEEAGRYEIYVQTFPNGGERHKISIDGGVKPIWSPDGRWIYYRTGDRIMAVSVSTAPRFQADAPRVLFEGEYEVGLYLTNPNFDIAPDGKSFVMVKPDKEWGQAKEIRVVLNWFEELKRLAPTE